MNTGLRRLFINPVLNKEIKLRLRSFKSFLGIFFYLAVLGLIQLGFIYMETRHNVGYFRPENSRFMFQVLSMAQLALILFMTPGLTAGVVSGERERQTLNILLTTDQSSTSIIISKLLSSVAFLILMIVSSLPLYSIVFLFGGVSPGMVVKTFGVYLLTIITVGSLGIMFSTLIRKTIVSMIVTYGAALFLVVGTFFIVIFLMEFMFRGGVSQPTSIWPYVAIVFNPVAILISWIEPHFSEEILRTANIDLPLHWGFVIAYLTTTVLALLISIKKLRPSMKVRKGRKSS